jgi:NAD(P)-dependent dehydrogenase (short-subunit alcohol dehydrogenase family)
MADTDVRELLDLSDETVLVTGASGNIGRAIARRLSEAGARVALHCFRNREGANELAAELDSATVVSADLCDAGAVAAMMAETGPSMLVNNAAAQPVLALADMTIDDWRQVLATNLDGPFLVMQHAVRAWGDAGGAVVNVASVEGLDPAEGHAHYASSKAGLIMLSRAAALEYGPLGVRVNCVSPGLIDRSGLAGDWPDGVARWLERAPLGRLGTPKDVADAVLFLLSPAARWISGANLVVDGGMSAQNRW